MKAYPQTTTTRIFYNRHRKLLVGLISGSRSDTHGITAYGCPFVSRIIHPRARAFYSKKSTFVFHG